MSARERLVTAQWVLERQLAWIAAADIKVGVVVTLDIAMLGGLAAAFTAATTRAPLMYVFAIIAAALALIALGCAAYSVMPQLDGPQRSMLYFGRVKETPRADYIEQFNKATDDTLLSDWTEQIHRNAEIACVKHTWVKKAMLWSFLSLLPWTVAVSMLVK